MSIWRSSQSSSRTRNVLLTSLFALSKWRSRTYCKTIGMLALRTKDTKRQWSKCKMDTISFIKRVLMLRSTWLAPALQLKSSNRKNKTTLLRSRRSKGILIIWLISLRWHIKRCEKSRITGTKWSLRPTTTEQSQWTSKTTRRDCRECVLNLNKIRLIWTSRSLIWNLNQAPFNLRLIFSVKSIATWNFWSKMSVVRTTIHTFLTRTCRDATMSWLPKLKGNNLECRAWKATLTPYRDMVAAPKVLRLVLSGPWVALKLHWEQSSSRLRKQLISFVAKSINLKYTYSSTNSRLRTLKWRLQRPIRTMNE